MTPSPGTWKVELEYRGLRTLCCRAPIETVKGLNYIGESWWRCAKCSVEGVKVYEMLMTTDEYTVMLQLMPQ